MNNVEEMRESAGSDPRLDLAAEAIREAGPRLGCSAEDIEDAAAMVHTAVTKWWEADRASLRVLSVEQKWTRGRRFGTKDLEAVSLSDPTRGVLIDWKTSSNQDLDARWAGYYTDSWQKKIYAWDSFLANPALQEIRFLYRGVTRPAATFDEKKNGRVVTRELPFVLTRAIIPEVTDYLAGFDAMSVILIEELFPVWPRHLGPSTCEAFGHRCPRYLDCRDIGRLADAANPISLAADAGLPPTSYSDIELFLLCPERARRAWLEGRENSKEGSRETRFGTLFHEAMAAVYKPLVEESQVREAA